MMRDKSTIVDIKRTSNDVSSASAGSHRRRRFPEKLVDKSRRVNALGQADVDNGASISAGLANVGQKIGMVVYRNFEVTPEDAGMSRNSITAEELRQVFGRENRVNIYTGQITKVSPNQKAFEHNINTFRGCSGAVIFLLDVDQEGCGVIESDYGKAIAVHVGGDRLSDGTIVNFAFKIP
eukprot:scaffold2447_cov110-Cylindrotheca_fusiformis.AAC.16